jgi:PleD family two-component response regulator
LVERFGGEKFALLLPQANAADAYHIAVASIVPSGTAETRVCS